MAPLRWGSLVLLAAALAGCQGTPLGDQLSRSFSSPLPAAAPADKTAAAAPTQPPEPKKAEETPEAQKPAPKPPRAPTAPRPRLGIASNSRARERPTIRTSSSALRER